MIFRSIRKRLRLFSILSSLTLVLLPAGSDIQACWFGPEPEEQRYMLFNPDLAHDKSWWTFFYNAKFTYLDGSARPTNDEHILAEEWLRELKVKASPAEAFGCFFGGLSDSALEHNTVYQAIQRQESFRDFFDLARSAESAMIMHDPWTSEAEKLVAAERRSALVDALPALVEKTRDPFLKRKYAYQLAKMAFYSDDLALFNAVYSRYFPDSNQDVLYWWATHYRSVLLDHQGEVDSANYFHARVFSASSAKMYISRLTFSRQRLDSVLALASNDHARADVLVLAEVINPGRSLDNLRRIYSLNPRHKHLPLLIGREINKLEDWLATTKYAGAERSVWLSSDSTASGGETDPQLANWKRDRAYLDDFLRELEKMRVLVETMGDQYNLAMSYLNLLRGDGAQASTYLESVKPVDPEAKYQVKVQQLILLTLREDVGNEAVQERIGKIFLSLLEQRGKLFESEKMLYSLCSYMRYVFVNKGNVAMAGLFHNLAVNKFCITCAAETFEYSMISYFDRYASIKDVEKVIALYNKPNKNTLEAVLLKPYATPYYLYDLLATLYLRAGKVKDAAGVLGYVPDDFWQTFSNASHYLDQDPFLDNAELLTGRAMGIYNKREILDRMLVLESEAVGDQSRRAINYFLLGNAWYNFTDNSWFMISYGRGGYTDVPHERFDGFAQRKSFAYYKLALQAATDDELRAKITYMLAVLSDADNQKRFAKAFERYHDTAFYNKRNCLVLKDLAE